jgi:hypothetical protein
VLGCLNLAPHPRPTNPPSLELHPIGSHRCGFALAEARLPAGSLTTRLDARQTRTGGPAFRPALHLSRDERPLRSAGGLACRRAPDQDGDRIALLAHNSTDLYEIMFACRTRSKLMRESRNERLWNDRLWRKADIRKLSTSVKCHRTNPLTREGLAAQSSDYVCRSNYLNERK